MLDDSPSSTVVIAGGSGFLGISLAMHLATCGMRVVILSRQVPKINGPWVPLKWDARSVGDWCEALDGSAGLVNLVGRSVDCVKTPDHQDEILRSRLEATRALGMAMRTVAKPPPVWVQMSTAHIYGDPPRVTCTEDSPFGYGFAPFVGRAWEEEYGRNVLASQRPVILRTSFVLGRDSGVGGGALARLRMLARLRLGGSVASGTQGMSWIHQRDMNRLFERAIRDTTMRGPYIASSPNPVSQEAFMATLRRVMGVRIALPASSWMVRIGAQLFLRTDPDLALYGRYVISKKLQHEHFAFEFPELAGALHDLLSSQT